MTWDVFISHASEDKGFVAPLVQKLIESNLTVWYDDSVLKPGDSLRSSIDNGLKESQYAVVILSHNFIKKKWTQNELNGFFSLEANGPKVIVPVWHGVKIADILSYSPMLADKVAIDGSKGIEFVVSKILEVVKPKPILTKLQEVFQITLPYGTPIETAIRYLQQYPESHPEITYDFQNQSTGHDRGSGGSTENTYRLMNAYKQEILILKELESYITSSDDFFDYSSPTLITVSAVKPLMDPLIHQLSSGLQGLK